MSERKLFNLMCVEGMILLILGLCILVLPKLTHLSFYIMTAVAFIVYGICKLVCSIVNRSYLKNFLLEAFLGIFLIVLGILLSLVPKISIFWLIALIGTYLILETASSTSFLAQVRTLLNFWYLKLFLVAMIFLTGLMILIKLPNIAFSNVAITLGAIYLLKGNCKMTLAKLNKQMYLEENREEIE